VSPELKSLDLAQYILHRIKHEENFNVNSIAKEFDNDEKFVKSMLDFLKELEWITEDQNRKYSLTSQGKENSLCYLRF
jgi:Mn-dependent DtxR family transcriptional regulator